MRAMLTYYLNIKNNTTIFEILILKYSSNGPQAPWGGGGGIRLLKKEIIYF